MDKLREILKRNFPFRRSGQLEKAKQEIVDYIHNETKMIANKEELKNCLSRVCEFKSPGVLNLFVNCLYEKIMDNWNKILKVEEMPKWMHFQKKRC